MNDLTPEQRRAHFLPLIREAATRHGVDADLVDAMTWVESKYRPTIFSPSGAGGLMQLMPGTARGLGLTVIEGGQDDRMDPAKNVDAGVRFLAGLLRQFGGDREKAVAAYNGGGGAITRWAAKYGHQWRLSLKVHRANWAEVAGYGGPAKADEVRLYLERVEEFLGRPLKEGEVSKTLSGVEYWSPNHGGKRPRTTGVLVHSTRSGRPSFTLKDEYRATINYFRTPGVQASSHIVVGPEEVALVVPDTKEAWHAGYLNQSHLGIEVCQPLPNTPYTEFQYRQTAAFCRTWAARFGFPLERVYDESVPGILGHEDTAQGRSYGKTDPGKMWDWNYFMALIGETPVPQDKSKTVPEPDRVPTDREILDEFYRFQREIRAMMEQQERLVIVLKEKIVKEAV